MHEYKEKYTISELIAKLQEIKEKEGDINVCVSEHHEYWGEVYSYLDEYSLCLEGFAQPDGPKSGKHEKAVVFKGRGC